MYRYLKNGQVEIAPRINIFKIFRYSVFFMRLKDKSLETRDVFQGENPYSINVKWTSGQMFITMQTYIIVPHLFDFFFNANPMITMNITFYMIHLREPSANCKHDKLVVGENGKMYTFCGFHSNFNLYPKFDKFSIKITLKLLRPFEMNATLSITDKDLIFNTVNFPQSVSNSDSIYKPQCYKVGGKFYVTSFLIRVLHTLKVRVDIISEIQNKYVIYDGPGNVFDTMSTHGTRTYYIASIFQCFLQILKTNFIQNHEYYFKVYSVVNHKRICQKIKPGFHKCASGTF